MNNLLNVDIIFRMKPDDDKIIFCNNVVLSKAQCKRSFGDWINLIIEFSQSLHSMELDISAFACLCAITLITGLIFFNHVN